MGSATTSPHSSTMRPAASEHSRPAPMGRRRRKQHLVKVHEGWRDRSRSSSSRGHVRAQHDAASRAGAARVRTASRATAAGARTTDGRRGPPGFRASKAMRLSSRADADVRSSPARGRGISAAAGERPRAQHDPRLGHGRAGLAQGAHGLVEVVGVAAGGAQHVVEAAGEEAAARARPAAWRPRPRSRPGSVVESSRMSTSASSPRPIAP